MNIKIIADSGANLQTLGEVDFSCVPLTIRAGEREFVDDPALDVLEMVEYLAGCKEKSGSACPGVGDFLEAFGTADEIYCVTIISSLSGTYNAAMTAKRQYEEEHPGKRVFVMDSVSAGPEQKLILEKLREYVLTGDDFDTVCRKIEKYKEEKSSLVFSLESLKNLVNNGRVSHTLAAVCSIAGIRIVGDVKDGLHPTDKCRGEKKAVAALYQNMKEKGYRGGLVVIDQCFNENGAEALKQKIREEYQDAVVRIEKTFGLCSYYAEKGGLMVGFERE